MLKLFKYLAIVLISIVYVIIQFIDSSLLPGYEPLWTTLTVIAALLLYFYNDSFFVFSFFNNFLNFIWRKPQVTWEIFYTFQTENENAFEVISERITSANIVEQSNKMNILHNTENYFEFEIEAPDVRKYRLSSQCVCEDIKEICLSYKCTLSYKNSKTELERAKKFLSKLFNPIEKKDCVENEIEPLLINPTYTLKLSFLGYNPVYGLMVKRINQNEIESFSLNFSQKKAIIDIEKNFMSICSEDIDQLEEISKHYLALSDLT